MSGRQHYKKPFALQVKNLAVDYTGEGLLQQASLGSCTLGQPPLTRVGPGEQAFHYIEMAVTK